MHAMESDTNTVAPEPTTETRLGPTEEAVDPPPVDPLAALLRAWFVTYNPVYLASAALVLAGLWLVSFDLAKRGVLGGLGVSAIAEVYALALIGGAAVLQRTGQRRAAVMLGLLAALYQCDLTLHVETASYLGLVGQLATLVWLAVFTTKLFLLARALELRPSRSAFWVPTLGAAGLALLPQLLPHLSAEVRASVVALALFLVFASAAWTSRSVSSAAGFDYRGRRSIRGVWLLFSAGALVHVGYWCSAFDVSPRAFVPALFLLATRRFTRERHTWAMVLGTLGMVAARDPAMLAVTALMAAITLTLHALRRPSAVSNPRDCKPPYRGALTSEEEAEITELAAPPVQFGRAPDGERARLLLGALGAMHLSLSALVCISADLSADSIWVDHSVLLDLCFVALCLVALAHSRHPRALAPLVPMTLHLSIQLRWLAAPSSAVAWGAWSIGIGFGLLGLGVAASAYVHRRALRSEGPRPAG